MGAAAFVSMPSTRHHKKTVVSKNDLPAETNDDDKDSNGDDDGTTCASRRLDHEPQQLPPLNAPYDVSVHADLVRLAIALCHHGLPFREQRLHLLGGEARCQARALRLVSRLVPLVVQYGGVASFLLDSPQYALSHVSPYQVLADVVRRLFLENRRGDQLPSLPNILK